MSNRGMVKWQPFSAVATGSQMINNALSKKNKIKMPILDEDKKEELQRKMMDSYNNQECVIVKYFKDGRLYTRTGVITNIDVIRRKMAINGEFWVFFSQIIDFL